MDSETVTPGGHTETPKSGSITVGDITGSIVAIGHGASVVVNQTQQLSPAPSSDELLVLFRESGAEFDIYTDTIASIQLERAEVAEIADWVLNGNPEHRLGVLLDQAGGGKTVVMRHIRQSLLDKNVPVLAIKADSLDDVRSHTDLRNSLKLPLPVEDCARLLASERPIVVLIDQLDALSLSLSRDQRTLEVLLDTIARLHSIQGVRIIASCRTFDLRNDPKLSTIKIDHEFQLGPLDRQQIDRVLDKLGIASDKLLPGHLSLLTVPLHLAIYARLVGDTQPTAIESYFTLQELYGALWNRRVVVPLPTIASPTNRVDAIYQLVDVMQDRRETKTPLATLDQYSEAARYLESVDFIRQERGNWHFFHQTLFDYCYARRFVARNLSLSRVVLNSSQGLFERSQVVQVLAYLRGTNEADYRRELNALLFADKLRVHLRLLILGWFGSLRNPLVDELDTVRRLIGNKTLHTTFLQAASGNEAWFDILDSGIVPSLLRSTDDELLGTAVIYLGTLMARRPAAVLARLRPFLKQSEVWDIRIAYCLTRQDNWQNEEAIELLCNLLERGRMGGNEDLVFYGLARTNPKAGCRALRILLDRRLNALLETETRAQRANGTDPTINQTTSSRFSGGQILIRGHGIQEFLEQAVQHCPDQVVEHILPWFVRAASALAQPRESGEYYPSDPEFASGWYGEHVMEGAQFALRMARALEHVAKTQPGQFRICAATIGGYETIAVQRVLAHAYLAAPEHYAHDIFDFLMSDIRRLSIGEEGEQPHSDSCSLVAVAFRNGDTMQRIKLEELILGYQPAWERRTIGRQGITRLRFLKSIAPELLSPKALRVRQELERKFPGFELRPPRGVVGGVVGSPIKQTAMDKMSDAAWLGAMRRYNNTETPNASSDDFLKGGALELSRAFAEEVKTDPDRFYRFALKIPGDVPTIYTAAAVAGLSESNLASERVFEVVRSCAHRVTGEQRKAVVQALSKRAKEGIPDDLIDLVEDWALHDPDPERESWRIRALGSGQLYYNGDPFNDGINTVRGSAIIMACEAALMRKPAQPGRALALLERASRDPSTAVRACLLEQLPYVLNHDAERVMAVFESAMEGHAVLLCCAVTHQFLYHVYLRHFPRIRSLIEQMLAHEDARTREYGAVLACLSGFYIAEAESLVQLALNGDTQLRHGAARVYAGNLDHPECEQICLARLELLVDDAEESIRAEVGECFAHAKSEQIDRLKPFLNRFLDSPALLTGTRQLVEYLKSVATVEHELVLAATERILNVFGERVVDISSGVAVIEDQVIRLPLTVYTHSEDENTKSRAMDLFERILLLGGHAARQALQEYDRR